VQDGRNFVILHPLSFIAMKKILLLTISCWSVIAVSAQNGSAPVKFETVNDSLSYSIGLFVGADLVKNGFTPLNVDLFMSALKAAINGEQGALTMQQAQTVFQTCQMQKNKEAEEKSKVQAETNAAAGKKFLDDNKKKKGIMTTESGLQYEIIKQGTGPKPLITDTVLTHYHGTLIDGTVFDSSVDRGQPIDFPLSGVIKGWQEGLQLMNVGSKYRLYVPSDLAYGPQQMGPKIGPNTTLIFEVELLGIKKDGKF
jgi:FKBP-type peptidyl-prolyl cis-trans isomerase FklB